MQIWDEQFAARSPLFAPLRSFAAAAQGAAWPTPDRLSALTKQAAVFSGGACPLQFTSAAAQSPPAAADYELRIHDAGLVPLREANWHDLFNALVWLAFPRTKAALNRAHAAELRATPGGARGARNARRDLLTLFDESGVLVLSSSGAVLEDIRAFAWKRVFWDERETLQKTTRFLVFGHGLYEKALSPYVGMSGHALLLKMPEDFEVLDESAVRVHADAVSAATLQADLMHPRDLSPLPLLGVPGWWDANSEAAFYDNTDYFRPGRLRQGVKAAG